MASSRKTATNENISTYGNVTRDYTVLATWEAATDIDLVSASQSEVLEYYDDVASFDDYILLDGAVANSSYFRIIRPASGKGHDGTPNNGVTFISTTDTHVFKPDEDYVQIQDIVAKLNVNSANVRVCFFCGTKDGQGIVGCIAYDSVNSGAGSCIGFICNTNNSIIVNCTAINNDNDGFRINVDAAETASLYNCTSVNNAEYGFNNLSGAGSEIAKNCCASGNTTADWNGTWTTKLTCTAEGANPTYVNAGENDFHLSANDTVCKGNGTDLSADGNHAFDDDIDFESRSAWDIGSDEYSWRGKINSVTNPAKINGIDVANISKVNGV